MRVIGTAIFTTLFLHINRASPTDYVVNSANGKMYWLEYKARPWDEASAACVVEGAKLAVPKTQEEFLFLQRIVKAMRYSSVQGTNYKLLVWLGINNREDHKIWKTVDGENIMNSSYHEWASGNGSSFSDNPAEPHCVGMDAVNAGFRDYWCHLSQPFICEK